ncbi:hypothetical protein H8E77_15920 [bacterium]|nr:hypothetical protein [bacterium]
MSNGRREIDKIRTGMDINLRSIPKSHEDIHLRIFALTRQKERLDRDAEVLEHKRRFNAGKLGKAREELAQYEESMGLEDSEDEKPAIPKKREWENKNWQTMSLDY